MDLIDRVQHLLELLAATPCDRKGVGPMPAMCLEGAVRLQGVLGLVELGSFFLLFRLGVQALSVRSQVKHTWK